MNTKSAFEQLHPHIRKQIYRMGWGQLRPIQQKSIFTITETLNHLIISAETASGKTEAAFLPILSSFVDNPTKGVKAIYVGPLKALINDQFERLEELCNYTEIPVYKWHGDVSQAGKKKARTKPSGVLLITPESIESLFINHSSSLKHMFNDLRYIVIDEMHSFIGTERGAHLKSLIFRLMPLSKHKIRLVGLSATLGDDELSKEWLSPDSPDLVTLVKGNAGERAIKCKLKGYIRKALKLTENSESSTTQLIKTPEKAKVIYRNLAKKYHPDIANTKEEKEIHQARMKDINSAYHEGQFEDLSQLLIDLAPELMVKVGILVEHVQEYENTSEDDFTIAQDILKYFYKKTALIFGTSRASIEKYADLVSRIIEKEKYGRSTFRVHHGSLSKGEREETENALKNIQGTATFCSSTLEMGIDVGNVEAVGQIGPTFSVNSLSQRLGRSGRREEESSTLLMFIPEDNLDIKQDIVAGLYPDLLQSIAMIELILKEWCEPPEIHRLCLSTFVQQAMSLIAETGARRADMLYKKLVTSGAFKNVDKETYIDILRSIKGHDLIEQTPEGELILGLEGERIVRRFDFYSAFTTPVHYRVIHTGRLIGTIEDLPGGNQEDTRFILLAGKRWKVLSVDHDRLEVIVEKAKAGKAPKFGGSANQNIHEKVRTKMFEILSQTGMPKYLDQSAKKMLASARIRARDIGFLENSFIQEDNHLTWFTWTSSKIHRTLWGLARLSGSLNVDGMLGPPDELTLTFKSNDIQDLLNTYTQLLKNPPAVNKVARVFPTKGKEKYDVYLDEELQVMVYASNYLDFDGSIDYLKRLLSLKE